MRQSIAAADFKDMILCADAALQANARSINELNVFPVPDGDTGTNMSLTVNNAANELRKKNFSALCDAADCVASGLLRGARGNSGVITSLLFRGLSRKLKGVSEADAQTFSAAMAEGVDSAYKAVMKPAEGTILTVSRLAAQAATEYTAAGGVDCEKMLELSLEAAREALADTVNQNPVLKKAGVVDAGGVGYITIYEAMLACLRGEATAPEASAPASELDFGESEGDVFGKFETEDITFAYDTVYIVKKTMGEISLEPLREYLSSIGDSLVIGEDDDCFKVHVHTNIPGEALTQSQKYGTLELAKIENMRTQHDELVESRASDVPQEEVPCKRYGAVAVSAGAGVAELFTDLGVDGIVTGGQTMNPATEDILREIERIPAETIFVFPNNKNIIMAAEQCIPLTQKKVVVIPTRSVPQCVSAMLCLEPEEDEETVIAAMTEAASRVHTLLVTYAARDSQFDGHNIKAGEFLALLDGALLGSYADVKDVLDALASAAGQYNPEIITVYYGEDVTEDTANAAAELVSAHFPEAETSVVNGGQPVYYYMISVE